VAEVNESSHFSTSISVLVALIVETLADVSRFNSLNILPLEIEKPLEMIARNFTDMAFAIVPVDFLVTTTSELGWDSLA
jgi:hypothetical protein